MMKRLLTLISFSLIAINAYATHIVGSTLTYVHNGGSSYTFTLKLYRDCGAGSAAFPGSVTINVRGLNGATFAPTKDFTMPGGTITNIPSNLDTCAVPPNPMPCVQERIYTATVSNLPPNPGGYHCYYQVCCRNLSTTNVNATCNCIGSSVYTYIPGPTGVWMEDFTLANGTTSDAGTTAWTRTTTATSAQVNNNLFESNGSNNGLTVWTSQVINIAAYPTGVTLSVNHSETSNLEAGDSIRTYYSLNGGPLTLFTTNGILNNDFTAAVATTGVLTGNTIQIVIRHKYDGASGGEILQSDNVNVIANNFLPNSSPTFNAFPPLFLCQGNVFNFNHAATDVDGDSLAYSFYTPYNDVAPTFPANTATFTPVTWLGGFSATNPLGGAPLTLVPTTGMMSGTPPMTGQFVVGVRVREYRNSVLLNEVTRDFQFNITFCPPPAQALIVPGDTINACSGLTVNFPNNSDPSANNWTWNFGNTAVTNDTSTLEFPSYSYPAPGSYTTMLIINAGTSCADTSYASVDVGFANANFTHNAPQCAGTNVTFTNSSTCSANTTITGYSWNFGDSQTSTATNPTHAYATGGTYTVTLITYTALGCTDTLQVPITITPTPSTPAATSNSPVCAGSTITLSTSAVPGATYSWTGPSAFTSTLQNPTRPSATAGMAGTYSVSVTVGGCTSIAGTVNVVVNPTPAAPAATSNSPICAGSTLNLSASNIVGATYSWTGPNSFTSTSQNPSIPAATIAASGTYSVTATVAGCTSVAGTIAVTVSPQPATPTASGNSPVCAGNTINLSTPAVVGATYSWTGPNGFTSTLQNPTVINAQAVNSGTYSVTVTVGGCTSNAGTVTITVNPTPATPAPTSNSPVCAGSVINLSTAAVVGATYSWTGPSAFTSTLQNPTRPSATLAMSGTYSVVVTVGGCPSAAGTVSVTVNPTPAAPTASSNSPICAGSNLNLNATNIAGATYNWTGPNSFTSTTQNPTITGATTAASGTYSVTATVAGCTSVAGTTTVTVNPIPATPTAGSNSPVCTGNTISLTTPAVVGATYSWTGPSAFTSTLQNPTRPGATLAMAGTYSVTITQNGCTSAAGTVNVVVNATPSAPTASSNSPICAGSTLNLSASNIVGATYSWTGPNSFTSTSQNPSIPNATTAASGTYSVTATVAGCPSAFGTVTVTVNPIPSTPTPSSNSPICVGQTLNLTTSAVVGATYSWTGPNSFSSALQNPVIPGATTAATGTYSLSVTVNGCTSATGTVVVLVSNNPPSPNVTSNTPICSGQTLQLNADTIAGATYTWTGPNGFNSTNQNPSIPNATTAASGTYTVTVFNGCSSAPATVSVVVNPTPATPIANSNSPICSGSNLNLTSNLVAGATYSWSGPNSFTSSLQNPVIAGATITEAGTYSVTVTVNGCVSSAGTEIVTVDPVPVASAGSSQTVCANNAIVALAATSSTGNGTWTTSGTGTFTPSANVLNPNYTPSNADTAAGSVVLTFTTTNNGACSSDNDFITITFTDAPTIDAGANQTVCANNAAVALNGTVTVASGGIWTTSGTGTFSPNNTSLSTSYVPSPADTANGTVTLYLSSTGNGTCLAVIDSMVVTITDAPTVEAGATIFRCSNNPNATLNGSSSTGSATWTTSGTGSFNPNANTLNAQYIPSPSDVSNGSVLLTLTSTANGLCNAVTDTVSIIYTQPPVVSASVDQTICANAGPVLLSGSSTTGFGTWTTSGSGTFSPNGLNGSYVFSPADTAAGTVTLTLTSTNNGGCLAVTDQMIVTITDAPVVTAGADISVCANNAVVNLNGGVTIATGGVWSTNGTGSFSPSASSLNAGYTPTAADTAAGTITIYLTSTGNGTCLATVDSLLVTFTDAPFVDAGDTILTCISSPNTPLSGTSTTGSGVWTTLGSGSFSPNNTTLNATYVPSTADTLAGQVQLILTSANNGTCNPEDDTVLIIFAPVPSVTTTPDQTVCANNAIVLIGATSSTGTGIWTTSGSGSFSPSATNLNPTYTPSTADTAAGTVTLTFNSTNGCTPISSTITITITDAPVVNAGADIFTCANNPNAVLNGSVGGATTTGVWTTSGSGGFAPANTDLNATYIPSAADTAAGSVMLVLTSTGNGLCNAESDTLILTITPPPTATAGPDLVACANNGVALGGAVSGGSGTGIWTTTNGSGTFSPSNTTLGAVYIPVNADTLISPVMIILTSTGNGGCLASADTLFITVNPGPEVNAGPDQTVCANNATVNLSGTYYLSTGIEWSSNGDGTFSPDTISANTTYQPGPLDTANGSVTIYLTTTGNGLCNAAIDSLIVTITDAPVINAGADQTICTGTTSATLNGNASGGASTAVWTTSGTGTFVPNDSTLNASYVFSSADTTAGSVTLYLTSTNNGLCVAEVDSMTIIIAPVPLAIAGNDTTVCANAAGVTLNGIVLGGNGSGVWSTSGDGTFTPNDSTLNATYIPGTLDTTNGTVTLILNATNACLPQADTVIITLIDAPLAEAGSSALICAGENVVLAGQVSNTTGGTWSTSGDGTFSPSSTNLNATYIPGPNDIASGSATLTLTADSTGFCSSVTDQITVTINSTPIADFLYAGTCDNTQTVFTDTSTNVNGAIVAWNWTFDLVNSDTAQNPTFQFGTAGTHTVTLIAVTAAGCSDTLTQTLTINASPLALYNDTTVCPTDGIYTDQSSIGSGSIATWQWSFGDSTSSTLQSPSHTYADTGMYIVTLTVTSDSGCVSSFSDTTFIDVCSDDITDPVLPSAFTPNGDGHNDVFIVRGGPMIEMELRVYNEWGNLIFTSTSQTDGWDGNYKSKPQPAGTYVWTLVGTTADGTPVNQHGSVTLMR